MLTVDTTQGTPINQPQSNNQDTLQEWQNEFNSHFATVPYTFTKKRPSLPASLGAKYPYELGLSQILELPLPPPIHVYLKTHLISIQLQLSLFDMELGMFFGDTWLGNPDTLVPVKSGHSKNAHVKLGSPTLLNGPLSTTSEAKTPISIVTSASTGSGSSRISLNYKNLCFYIHSPVTSPHVIAIIEFVFIVSPNTPEDAPIPPISGGWSFFYPFDATKGGLDVNKIWKDQDFALDEVPKTVPIFNGTPRVLPLAAPLIMGALSGFPGLSIITGASLNFRFIARPDVVDACYLWNENTWISPGDRVPGLQIFNAKQLVPRTPSTAILSNLCLKITPSIQDYEKRLLEKVALIHFEADPASMLTDEDGSILLPSIKERRIKIGFHNGHTFVDNTVLTNVIPNIKDHGQGTDLYFKGQVELPHYMEKENGMALVFIIEYKIELTVRAPIEKKSAMTIIKESFSRTKSTIEKTILEKVVSLGWANWNICDSFVDKILQVPIKNKPGPNPFSTVFYIPHQETVQTKNNESTFKDQHVLELSFKFHDESNPPLSSVRASPVMWNRGQLVDEATSPLQLSEANLDTSGLVTVKSKKMEMMEEQDEQEIHATSQSLGDASQFPSPYAGYHTPLTRVEKARLLNAGFNVILDEDGKRPISIGSSLKGKSLLKSDFDVEKQDLRFNDITFTFMGISFNSELFNRFGGFFPTSVYFSLQFYNFSYSTTERLHIYTGPLPPSSRSMNAAHHRSSSVPPLGSHARQWSHISNRSTRVYLPEETEEDEYLWPDGKAPGLSLNHLVDPNLVPPSPIGNPRFGPEALVHYMANNQVFIDLWDGDSLLHLGVCTVSLKSLLRQGKPGVTLDEDLDIILTEFPQETSHTIPRSSSVSSTLSTASGVYGRKTKSITIGKLHLRLTNIGKSMEKLVGPVSYGKDVQKLSLQELISVSDYHENIKKRLDVTLLPKRMPEIDLELKSLLQEANEERALNKKQPLTDSTNVSDKIKKLEHTMKLLSKSESPSQEPNTKSLYQMNREERSRDLQTMDIFRERKKKTNVQNALREQITTRQVYSASFGQAIFFEFNLTNPYNIEHNVEIEWTDAELRLVKDSVEWKYLRKLHNIRGSMENRIIAEKSDGTFQVYLFPNETLAIPFVFQSFSSGLVHSNTEYNLTSLEKGLMNRTISVSFLNVKKSPIAILDICIQPRYYYIDKSMRFFKSENDIIRQTIKVPVSRDSSDGFILDASHPSKRYLRCNHPDVICSLSEHGNNSSFVELKFKLKTDAAPNTKAVYFLLYLDPYCTVLGEVWRVFIHSLQRLDVTCTLGQTNNAALIVKGSSHSRYVECFSNQPQELIVIAPGPFLLTSNTLNEIGLYLKPKMTSVKEIVLNVVDVELKSLLSSWLVVSHANPPSITKSFDVICQRGKSSNKRVSYTNPYAQRKTLYLKTDSEHLLQFKESILELGPGDSKYLGLVFTPCNTVTAVDVLVFLNDEQDQIEECLRVSVRYE